MSHSLLRPLTVFDLQVILLVVFVVPIFLFAKVIKRRGQREKALNSGSSDDMKKWFKELDEDSSGALESDEIIRLLEKMDVGDDWVKTGMAELDKEVRILSVVLAQTC